MVDRHKAQGCKMFIVFGQKLKIKSNYNYNYIYNYNCKLSIDFINSDFSLRFLFKDVLYQ